MRLPAINIFLEYSVVYGEEPPTDSLSLIKSFSKEHILYEIVALNYRLKPKYKFEFNDSWENQLKELEYFSPNKRVYDKIYNAAIKYNHGNKEFASIFNRQACAYAIEEIVNDKDYISYPNFIMNSELVWENILKYLLVINTIISDIKDEKDEEEHNFETLNPRLLPLNELAIASDPIFTPRRGLKLIEFFSRGEYYKDELEEYFKVQYNISPIAFVFRIMSLYMTNSSDKPDLQFFYLTNDNDVFLKALSKRLINEDTYKLISIKKSPFIDVGENKYLISDNVYLLEKTYNQLVNDFWFDYVKPRFQDSKNNKYTVEFYRSIFGYFFEKYVDEIIHELFLNYKYSSLITFSSLKWTIAKDEIEIADIYFRYGKRILLGQVKGGNIYDKEKYGRSTEDLYKKDRNSFFENFGVNQIVESITTMNDYISFLDKYYPKGHPIIIFPVIIVNDKSLQTPLMADTFNIRFQELIKNLAIDKITIKPLSIIHISDLERLQYTINETPKRIWELLESHVKDKRFIPPFYDTLNKHSINMNYSKDIIPYFQKMIESKT